MKKVTAIAGLAALALGAGVIGGCGHMDREDYTCTVTDKQVKRYHEDGESKDKYLVFCKLSDGKVRVFENTDSTLEFKWDSSNIQGKLEKGKTYKIGTYGFRIPFFSSYENIVDVRPVETGGLIK